MFDRDLEEQETNLRKEFDERESLSRDSMEQHLRVFEDRKQQLRKKVAVLEAALKQSVEKVEADQKSLQSRHEMQLSSEKQLNLKLRGESGILKKTVTRYGLFITLNDSLQHFYECNQSMNMF